MTVDVTPSSLAPESLGPTITVGEILVEIMATTIGKGFLDAQPLIGPFPSGAPAIFIDQVAKLGGQAGIIAAVGNDDFGRLNVERLRRDGADVSAIAVSPDYPTGSAFVRYADDGTRDFVYNIARSAAGNIDLNDSARALIGRAGHLHVMGSALSIPAVWPIIDYALREIKQRGGTLSLDPNMRKELAAGDETGRQFKTLVAACDLLLPSGDELFVACPAATEDEAIQRVRIDEAVVDVIDTFPIDPKALRPHEQLLVLKTRGAHPRDARGNVEEALRDLAAHQVGFILGGTGDEQVGVAGTGLGQHGRFNAAAHHAAQVKA